MKASFFHLHTILRLTKVTIILNGITVDDKTYFLRESNMNRTGIQDEVDDDFFCQILSLP